MTSFIGGILSKNGKGGQKITTDLYEDRRPETGVIAHQ